MTKCIPSFSKIVEIMYVIYQGLTKRRLHQKLLSFFLKEITWCKPVIQSKQLFGQNVSIDDANSGQT